MGTQGVDTSSALAQSPLGGVVELEHGVPSWAQVVPSSTRTLTWFFLMLSSVRVLTVATMCDYVDTFMKR